MLRPQISFTILSSIALLLGVESLLYSPFLQQKQGPLYDAIKLLLHDEQFHAQLVWNETAHHVREAVGILNEALNRLDQYDPVEKFNELKEIHKRPKVRACFKDYEREVAEFNRELIEKYKACRQTADIALSHIENDTLAEITFIRNAADEVKNISQLCKIDYLRREKSDVNPIGILMCVLSKLGTIELHLSEASLLCLDIITEVLLSGNADIDVHSCLEFEELNQSFDAVYNRIVNCAKDLMV